MRGTNGITMGKCEMIFDKTRGNYYDANAVKKWEDVKNYDLVLDNGVRLYDDCFAQLMLLEFEDFDAS